MILDVNTISILKNFSSINQSLLFKKGNTISTMTVNKSILATATVGVTFERDFGIYRLDKFLSVLSMFKDPEIELGETSLTIKSGKSRAKIQYADPATIVFPVKENIALPSVDAEIDITEEDITALTKFYSVMEMPEISFYGDGEKIYLQAFNSKRPEEDNYRIELGETNKNFNAIFKTSNLKIIPAKYHVQICAKGIAQFSSDKLTYWIPVEANSEFN